MSGNMKSFAWGVAATFVGMIIYNRFGSRILPNG